MTSEARDRVYDIAQRAERPIEAGGGDDDRLHNALNRVEDDAVHAAAEKLRAEADDMGVQDGSLGSIARAGVRIGADCIDPYELVEDNAVCGHTTTEGKPVGKHWHHKVSGAAMWHVPVKERN